MKRTMMSFVTGCIMGCIVAINYEDELVDTVYQAKRAQKKIMRKVHDLSK